jgi:hypothetical protein
MKIANKKKPAKFPRIEIVKAKETLKSFTKNYWIGTVVILLATLIFFAPIISRINNYSEGGDAMFNAWTLARNHNCIKREGCPRYVDGNIYYPNKDTMLYSETQLSTGILTLPLSWISENPVFYYNVWMVLSFFLNGWFVYLLAKRLSKGHEGVSILAGLVFQFAPLKMASVGHMQNLSIFYLPLAMLLIIKYLDTRRKSYLVGLFISLTLLFYASWYQMVFALGALTVMLLSIGILKIENWKRIGFIGLTVLLSIIMTLPLAKEYIRFSSQNEASFSIGEQPHYSSSIADYMIPHYDTLAGKLYGAVAPGNARRIPYNLDSFSYHGFVLYILAVIFALAAFTKRKKNKQTANFSKWIIVWLSVGSVGFVLSLGPLLKVGGSYIYARLADGTGLSVPMPYLLIDVMFPQLMFIRAVGRWSVIMLLALSILLAYLPQLIAAMKWNNTKKKWLYGIVIAFCVFEIMPLHLMYKSGRPESYNLDIPRVYRYVKQNQDVDNIIILAADKEYPSDGIIFAQTEWILWAGYHNKNIFNGYSGYTPKNYTSDLKDFQDLKQDDIDKMKNLGLKYVIVDKLLSSTNPALPSIAINLMQEILYEDERYVLLKIPN